jgi:hypothetical protein
MKREGIMELSLDLNNPEYLWRSLLPSIPKNSLPLVQDAYFLARQYHAEQFRFTNGQEPRPAYIVHPLRVALILAEEWGEAEGEVLATALLHDVFQGVLITEREEAEVGIRERMGSQVFEAIHLLTKPHLPTDYSTDIKYERDARYFKVLFEAQKWIRLVKCADRLDNLRDAAQWNDLRFWERYSNDTIGWHLYLARNASARAEVALFKALVEGERRMHGRGPVWLDGRFVHPHAAALIPEDLARGLGIVGLALKNDTLVVGVRRRSSLQNQEMVKERLLTQEGAIYTHLELVGLSDDAILEAHEALLYGN